MDRDLSMYLSPLEAQPDPGLDTDDPRLAELVALADRGKYDSAADQAEALASEGVHDIRALSYLLYQAFREGGLTALGDIFEVILGAIGSNSEAIGPKKRKKDHFNRRLTWLFNTIVDALEYDVKNRTPEWDAFCEGAEREVLSVIIRAADRVAGELTEDVYATAATALGRLAGFLRSQLEKAPEATRAPQADAGETPSPAPAAPQEAPLSTREAPPGRPDGVGATVPVSGAFRNRVELVVSHQFLDLVAKLRAFEVLLEKGEVMKAAVVAEDVQQLIESFDPRAHFPELFARFSALLSNNIAPVSECFEERDSLAWKALGQYYRVDLDGFVRS
jgi:hypothetical protein